MSGKLHRTAHPGIYEREVGNRGGKRYVLIARRDGKQRKTFHATLPEAIEAKRTGSPVVRPATATPFDQYAPAWIAGYTGRTSRPITESTRESYRDSLTRFAVPFFGAKPIGDFGPLDVKRWVDWLAQESGLSPATVRRVVAPVRAMLAEAYELQLTPTNAGKVRVVVQGEPVDPRPKSLSPAEVATLLAAIPERHRLLFDLLWWTGLRIGEALGATWGDFMTTEAGPVLRVGKSKTRAGVRTVALVPPLARALTERRNDSPYPASTDPIFPTRTGRPLDAHNVRRLILKPAAIKVGFPWVTPHTFRHSRGTHLNAEGYSANDIARVLGHADASFTQRRYIHPPDAPRFDDLAEGQA